ncbi:hypothetical protein Tco_0982473 [Tanacetum coccineum]
MNPDKRIVIPRPVLPSPSSPRTPIQNRFTPLIPTYSSITRPRNRPPYSPLAHLQGMPPIISPYNKSPTSISSPNRPKSPSINTEVQFYTNQHKQTVKILEPFEEQKLNQGFPFAAVFKLPWIISFTHKKQERQGNSPPLLIRQFSVKWWKQIEDKQASKEAVIRYYNDITTESSSPSPSYLKANNKRCSDELLKTQEIGKKKI